MDFKKEIDYGQNANDYVIDGEITVTITLSEYRKLVATWATTNEKVEKANQDRYARETENERLKKENQELRNKIYELQNGGTNGE